MPLNINFGNAVRRETKKLLDDIEKEVNLLENDKILKEFKRNDLTILKKAGLPFLTKNFQSYNHKRKIDSVILINIGYLSILKKSGIQFNDLDFLEFIISLLSSDV